MGRAPKADPTAAPAPLHRPDDFRVGLPTGARRDLIGQFRGDEQLVVIRSNRFSAASTLLREWLTVARPSDAAVAPVISPRPGTTERDYWARLEAELRGSSASRTATPGDAGTAFASLLDALSTQTGPCVLVLDDLHLIVDAVSRVDDLSRNAPPDGVKIIATTRMDLEWPGMGPLGQGCRFIGSEALDFSPDDIAALLRTAKLDYDVRTPEILHRLTHGLPALVHAACNGVPPAELCRPEHLTGHIHRSIDRLVDRTIRDDEELTTHRRNLLLSAAADPFTPENALLLDGGADSTASFLSVLDRSGLRRTSGAPGAPEWRYPNAVRLSLLRLAEAEVSLELCEYRDNLIAAWLSADRPGDAVRVAEESKNWPLVVDLIRENFQTLYTRDYPTTMADQVLARVPKQLIADDPLLSRTRAIHLQFGAPGDAPVRAEPGSSGAVVLREVSNHSDGRGETELPDRATRLDLVMTTVDLRLKGRFDEAAETCAPAVRWPTPDIDALSTDDRDARGFAYIHIGLSLLMAGRFAESITAFRRALQASAGSFIRRDAAGKLALAYMFLDDRGEAERWLAEERRHQALPSATEILVRPAGDVAAALLALDRADAEGAMDILRDLGTPADREELWGFILYAGGQLALVNDTADTGLRFIERAMLRFTEMRDHGAVVAPLLDAVRADLHLRCGRPRTAAELLKGSSHALTAPVRARILLAGNQPEAALELALASLSDQRTTTRGAVELELVSAAAALAIGDRTQAHRFLASAVSTSRLTGILRPLWSLPCPVVGRLADLSPEFAQFVRDRVPLLAKNMISNDSAGAPVSGGAEPGRVAVAPAEQLTSRELAVLRDLATHATVRQIAERHYVSVNTIKTQVSAVYRKLSVRSRGEALAVAQRRGLL